MRFAYIDSQGNEVAIPSVDALALRIELGAISEDTELYDAQADRWGPAHSHEIFHTLSRSAEDDGFVPPPPVAPPPPALDEAPAEPEPEPEPEVATEEAVAESPEPVAADDGEGEVDLSFDLAGGLEFEDSNVEVAEPSEEPVADPGDDFLGGGLDLAPMDAAAEEPAGPGDSDDMSFGDIGLDLAAAPAAESDAGGAADEDEEEAGGFDFGDFSGGLELEGADDDEDDDEGAMDFGAPAAAAPDDGMALESPMDFAGGGDMGGGLELETPMSEFTAEDPPAWMEQDGPGGSDDDSMSFEAPPAPAAPAAPAATDSDSDEEPKERPKPRSRPSPPKRRKKAPVGAIMGVVGIAVVGGGGFFAFKAMSGGGSSGADEVVALPDVVIPDIPAELLPQMRDLAEAALAAMLADLTQRGEALDIPLEPRDEWLGGNYLANASQFEDIEQFWLGIERFVDEVRASDVDLFHDKYQEELAAAGVDSETGALMSERADSGFVAARDGRFEVYGLMDDLVNASLDLHLFLLDNEADIEWQPASAGFSADPVLEAVPATEVLEEEMLNRITEITRALADLGTLDRVTRERLFAVLFDRIRRAGIQ